MTSYQIIDDLVLSGNAIAGPRRRRCSTHVLLRAEGNHHRRARPLLPSHRRREMSACWTGPVRRASSAYFDGALQTFAQLPIRVSGAFRAGASWQRLALRDIAVGEQRQPTETRQRRRPPRPGISASTSCAPDWAGANRTRSPPRSNRYPQVTLSSAWPQLRQAR